MSLHSNEKHRLAFPTLSAENPAYISSGLPASEACARHVKATFHTMRVFILASGSLSRHTDEVEKLKRALGDRYKGEYVHMAPHSPIDQVLEATESAREKDADCIVTIGGGSLTDAGKAMLLFLANDVRTVEDIYVLYRHAPTSRESMRKLAKDIPIVSPTIPLISIPTTLSGGEYSCYAGMTDPATHEKIILGHPFCGPRLMIHDPKLAMTSPEWVWLSTGVRSIDHCVENFCRMQPMDEELDEAMLRGVCLLVPSLLFTKKNPNNDQDARAKALEGVACAMLGLNKLVLPGASHGIGHQLGPLGVAHGQTSCILLPSVMKWNKNVNAEKQEKVKKALWEEVAIVEVLKKRGLEKQSSDVGDALDAIFRELGMPRSLKEVNIGRDKFDTIAGNSLKDPCCQANPIPLTRKEQVFEILEMCIE